MRLTVSTLPPKGQEHRVVRIGPTAFAPTFFTATIEFEDDHIVSLDIEIRDGRPECCAVHVHRGGDQPSLTGDELRRLPVASWVEAATTEAARLVTYRWKAPAPREDSPVNLLVHGGEAEPVTADDLRSDAQTAHRRKVPLEDVAFAYDQANGNAPEVARILGKSRAQTYRLIKAAKESGHINGGDDGKR